MTAPTPTPAPDPVPIPPVPGAGPPPAPDTSTDADASIDALPTVADLITMPGMPTPTPAGSRAAALADVGAALDGIVGGLSEISAAVAAALDARLSAVERELADLAGLVVGWADRQMDLLMPPLHRAQRRVVQSIDRQMTDVYGYLLPAGVTYPMADQVLYGIATGDWLGSVGLAPPTTPMGSSAQIGSSEPATPSGSSGSSWPATPIGSSEPMGSSLSTPMGSGSSGSSAQMGSSTPTPMGSLSGSGSLAAQIAAGVAAGVAAAGPQCCPPAGAEPEPAWGRPPAAPPPPPPPATTTPMGSSEPSGDIPLTALGGEPLTVGQLTADPIHSPAPLPAPPPPGTTRCPSVGRVMDWGRVPVDCDAIRDGADARCSDDSVLGFGSPAATPVWWQHVVAGMPGWMARALTGVMVGLDRLLSDAMSGIGDLAGCTVGRPALARWVLGMLDGVTGGALRPYLRGLDQSLAARCPQEIPSASEATRAFLGGQIDIETWRCWTAANNQHVAPARSVMDAQRSRPGIRDIISLWRRGALGEGAAGDEEFRRLARQEGYIYPADLEREVAAQTQLPSLSEIIRFMVRDAADDKVAAAYGLDDEFERKYSGQLPRWARAQGVPDEVARMAWRSHWRIPSDTQLFEMLHRLRPPGENEVGPDADRRRRIAVDQAKVAEALGINDLAPDWRERLMAISYHPLTRVDVRRAYEMGLLTEDDVKANYLDLGYTPADADRLTAFARREREMHDLHLVRSTGREYYKLALEGVISPEELRRELLPLLPGRAEIADRIVEAMNKERHYRRREAAIECVRTEFTRGWIRDGEALRQLLAHGVPLHLCNEHISDWKCSMLPTRKLASAADLCEQRERGLIDAGQHLSGLVALGWSPADAQRITDECLVTAADRAHKKQIAELRRQYQQDQKRQKEAAAAERRRQREARAAAKRKCQEDRAAEAGKPPPC